MKSSYQFVQEWTEAIDGGVPSHPSSLTYNEATHREALMREELDELCEELYSDTLVHAVKELCDTLWVVYGTAIAMGISEEKLKNCMSEVYRSNMSKFGPDGKPIRNDAGKVTKGPNYSPADLLPILFS